MLITEIFSKVIQTERVRLEKLSKGHIDGICNCLLGEPDGWFSQMYGLNTPEALKTVIERRLILNEEGKSVSFVTIDLRTSQIAGISHFLNIDKVNRQLEIGGTQVGRDFRKTYVNTETKYLMLSQAFEILKAIRVYFKVDEDNVISQKSVIRLGAKFEGVLRSDWILPDGRIRNSHLYSIIAQEWPKLKFHIEKQFRN